MTQSFSSLPASGHSFPEATIADAASMGLLIIVIAGNEPAGLTCPQFLYQFLS
jgi:hypothetical protein